MSGIHVKTFDRPDQTRTPAKTTVEVLELGGAEVARFTFDPGWTWSECIKPVVGTDSCQVDHVGLMQTGRLVVRHEDGSEATFTAGDAYRILPGHDAWVDGDEPVVAFEFKSAADYARG